MSHMPRENERGCDNDDNDEGGCFESENYAANDHKLNVLSTQNEKGNIKIAYNDAFAT